MESSRSGLFTAIVSRFSRPVEEEEESEVLEIPTTPAKQQNNFRSAKGYDVMVRPTITSFDDAAAAANGLKNGELQIMNLTQCDADTRQRIVDFMCGVNFTIDGTWERVGDHIYMIAPPHANITVAPPCKRSDSN